MMRMSVLLCAVGTAMLFGAGCGGPVEDTESPSPVTAPAEAPPDEGDIKRAAAVYTVCWPALGVYSYASVGAPLYTTLHSGSGNNFNVVSGPFISEGEYWAYGHTTQGGTWGYVRWNGLCH